MHFHRTETGKKNLDTGIQKYSRVSAQFAVPYSPNFSADVEDRVAGPSKRAYPRLGVKPLCCTIETGKLRFAGVAGMVRRERRAGVFNPAESFRFPAAAEVLLPVKTVNDKAGFRAENGIDRSPGKK